MSADPLPTAQINGVAWSQAVAGNKVYVGGEFTSARPAGSPLGTNESPRSNLLAYNLSTGVLDSSWAPSANGAVYAMATSPDGTRLYVGGSFTSIAGATRYRIAAFDTATGSLVPNWAPALDSKVSGIVATNTTVYFTGSFSSVSGNARGRIAAVTASNGSVISSFAPTLDGGYGGRAIVVSPDGSKVVVAGSFLTTNGSSSPGRGIAALDTSTGSLLPWAVGDVLHNAGDNAAMYSLASDGDSVYGSGYDYGGSKTLDDFEGSFRASWSDGTMQWMEDCHGDTYAVAPLDGVLYTAAHTHYCGNIGEFPQLNPWHLNHSLAFAKQPSGRTITADIYGYRSFTGQPAGQLLHWYPLWTPGTYTDAGQAAWTATSSGNYLLYGGEFTKVSKSNQQGLVRFAVRSAAPNKIGPTLTGGNYQITTLSFQAGAARISWQANEDIDDTNLVYRLYRQGTVAPLYETSADSNYWVKPTMTYMDTGLTPGQTYNYRVEVVDPWGNSTRSDWTPVTVASTGSMTAYNSTILNAAPTYYWPLNESSGTAAYDWSTANDATLSSTGITRGATGPDLVEPSVATTFSGATGVSGGSAKLEPGPQTFSIEAWFRTTSTRGGKIVGFGSSATGSSSSYDRHVYMSGSGVVTFGVYPGSVQTVASGSGYNNGQWHHVVATLSSSGMALYLDDKKVASRANITSAQAYSGYWRIGGDNYSSWPNTGTSAYFAGDIADVAVYDRALTMDDVDAHWVDSGRTSTIPAAPSDLYGKSVYDLNPDIYWRLGESSGTVAAAASKSGVTGTYYGGSAVTQGVGGALMGVANTAISLAPLASQTGVSSNTSFTNPTVYSVETWFKTTTTAGGKLIGFGDKQTGTSSSYDRHIYMSTDGTVKFGVWTGSSQVIQSAAGYNDGTWHHVVGTQSSDGMKLYLDGSLVASNNVTTPQSYTGYWRIGGDSGWEGATWWTGSLDEVAVYPAALTASQVQDHYSLGKDGKINQLPTASFVATPSDLTVGFDGSASNDPDGTITSYAWDFGDGQADTGVAPSHTYASAGTYTVKLTVTDDSGATASYSAPVSAVAPNVPPTADFTATMTDATVSVDGTASSDSDGTIQSFDWDFGDGSPHAIGETASHTYAQDGTYTVTLAVTDNRGATSTLSKDVTAVVPNVAPAASFTSSSNGLTASFNGLGSSDPDGTIASYAWDFGDGQTDTGASPSHTYAAEGTYTVSLTVTDNDDATNSVSHDVTVAPVNQAPSAVFTSSVAGLAVSFDGSGSSDPDGTIASYNWDFGDGSTHGSNPTESHTYAAGGTYTVSLTVTDNDGATNSVSHDVTVTAPNQAPSAAFTSSVAGLAVSFDGSGSSDPDGTIASYAWDFGDGGTASTTKPSHTYAADGTYTVTLTVTDNDGATGTISHDVTVAAVTENVLAKDSFSRTLSSGWGSADTGGSWTLVGGTGTAFSVSGGVGVVALAPGSTREARLTGVLGTSSVSAVSVSSDAIPSAGATSGTVIGRRVGSSYYGARVRFEAGGVVRLYLLRDETSLGSAVLSGAYTAGRVVRVEVSVTGTSPTTIAAKIWYDGDAKPSDWTKQATDSTAAMQTDGYVGLRSALSSTAATGLNLSYDDYKVTD